MSAIVESGGISKPTIASLFEVVSKLAVQAEIQSIVDIVALFVTDLAPLKDDLYDHEKIH
jgi:hypothetical protein